MTEKTDSAEPRLSHARDYTRPGFYAKLVLMALINAFGLYGIMVSVPRQQWLSFFGKKYYLCRPFRVIAGRNRVIYECCTITNHNNLI